MAELLPGPSAVSRCFTVASYRRERVGQAAPDREHPARAHEQRVARQEIG
jgi:hypothetical protein